MKFASVSPVATAAPLKTLIGNVAPNEVSLLIVQAPSGNANTVYFGNSAIQTFELAAGDPWYTVPADIPGGRINLNDLYFKGTAPDKLNVAWVGYGKES